MLALSLWLSSLTTSTEQVIARSQLFATIPSEVRLAEAIGFERSRLLTGSVIDGGLWLQERGRWRRLAIAGMPQTGVLAVASAARPERFWVSMGAPEPFAGGQAGFRGLVLIDMRRLAVVRRVSMPAGAVAGDLAAARDGSIYISDQAHGGVYRCRPGCPVAEQIIAKTNAPSPQGIAPVPNGTVYLADYSRGILRLDPRTRAIHLVTGPKGTELRGIDGLVWWRGQLIGIQNGTRTRRILRIVLDSEGRAATSVMPIEQGHPEWGEPTLAAVKGDRLFYIADAQWEEWGEGGNRKAGSPLRPTPVRVLRLRD